jgi:hypothetical protein
VTLLILGASGDLAGPPSSPMVASVAGSVAVCRVAVVMRPTLDRGSARRTAP